MKKLSCLLYVAASFIFSQSPDSVRSKADNYLETLRPSLFGISDTVWAYSEPSFMEHRTANLYKTILIREGFAIEDSISGYSTMFIASYGSKGPVIGILAEADADSPLQPIKQLNLPISDFGHGAGHHLLGTGSLGAAMVLKKLIQKGDIDAQIKFFFSSGEGSLGGRSLMARQKKFDDVDLAFFWHPAPVTSANLSKWDALIDLEVTYSNNTLKPPMVFVDYIEQLKNENGAAAVLRTKIQNTQFNLAIPNDSLKLLIRIQHSNQEKAVSIYKGVVAFLEKQEKNNPVDWKVFRALHEFIPTRSGNERAHDHITDLEKRTVTLTDMELAELIYELAAKEKGSFLTDPLPLKKEKPNGLYGYASDIGDVSWQAPLISFVVSWIPTGLSMRNWEATAFGNSEYAKEAMIQAAKIITYTTLDYLHDPILRRKIKLEFDSRKNGRDYFDEIEIYDLPVSKKKRSD
ncbi:hypothetical protein [Flagellimonas sp.]|uniref:hypothetical protein n=1 Tax=Flagellimonas sp. TaxID=2058762 RepID=UPI003B505CD0